MTNAADAPTVVKRLAEAMALGIDTTEVAASAQGPTSALLEEHPAPWSYQEELEGQPAPRHSWEEPEACTNDARRRHVVRDALGAVVAECVKFSKHEEEQLASAIASIPVNITEIERLSAGNEQLKEAAAHFDELAGFAAKENADLHARNAELESTIVKLTEDNHWIPRLEAECSRLRALVTDLCEVLLKASPGQGRAGDARIALAAKLLIEADVSFSELALISARAVLDATAGDPRSCCVLGVSG